MADIGAYKKRGDAECPVCKRIVVSHDDVIDRHDCIPVCSCGLNLHIWQNEWNHAPGCSVQPVAHPHLCPCDRCFHIRNEGGDPPVGKGS